MSAYGASSNPPPDYGSYLQLGRLLDLQIPLSRPEHPDELHFIVTHQAMELWFKVMIADVRRARQHVQEMEWARACQIVERLNAVLRCAIMQLRTLDKMGPQRFQGFRSFLGTASGFQSVQFRVLEVLNGFRDADFLEMVRSGYDGKFPEPLAAALSEPSLSETVESAGRRTGVLDWADIYSDVDDYSDIVLLTEHLLDYDELWLRWRSEHVVLVNRIIGSQTRGTGGSPGDYLTGTLSVRLFPFLWDLRNTLSERAAGKAAT